MMRDEQLGMIIMNAIMAGGLYKIAGCSENEDVSSHVLAWEANAAEQIGALAREICGGMRFVIGDRIESAGEEGVVLKATMELVPLYAIQQMPSGWQLGPSLRKRTYHVVRRDGKVYTVDEAEMAVADGEPEGGEGQAQRG